MVALHLTPMASHKQDASNLESDRLPKKKEVPIVRLTSSCSCIVKMNPMWTSGAIRETKKPVGFIALTKF